MARALFLLLLLLFDQGAAQTRSPRLVAQDYLQQCLRFEAGGDFETARQSCQAALGLEPGLVAAELALARVELALGENALAETRLRRLQSTTSGPEAALLLTDLLLRQGRLGEAESTLAAADRLEGGYGAALEGRRLFLAGQLAELRGDYRSALDLYRAAIVNSPRALDYRLADARLRLNLGDPVTPQRDLLAYLAASGQSNAELFSLVGRAKWINGELEEAASFLERAVSERRSHEAAALADDRRALMLVYYGQGDWRAGELVLRGALRRDNLLAYGLSFVLPWLVILLGLLGLHLLGESRIAASSSFEMVQRPEPWTVGNVYRGVGLALLVAAPAAMIYGFLAFGNWLAFVTPLQSADVRACYLTVLALVLLAVAFVRVRRNGWEPYEALLGRATQFSLGLALGLGLILIVVLYILYAPEVSWLQGFYLDYTRLNLWLVIAVIAFPLSELFFRAFAIAALTRRYSPALAVAISAALFALVVGMPLPLVLLLGGLLGEAYRRTGSGLVPLLAQWVLHLGLLFGAAYSGWVRALFL